MKTRSSNWRAGDITDRPYTVIGQITASARKAPVLSALSSPEKVYREFWERGQKMHADAVIHATCGKADISAMSWGQTASTGTAVTFSDTSNAAERN